MTDSKITATTARYAGTCPDCEQRWSPGDLIRRKPETLTQDVLWQHAVCPDDIDDLSLQPGEHVCTSCFLTICDYEREH